MPATPTIEGRPTLAGIPVRLSPRAFARYAWFVLIFNLGVVLWGAYVRATGSGAGCGNHWPLCDGVITPVFSTVHKVIEFTHRASTGLDGPLVLLLVIWAFKSFSRKHPVRLAATFSGVFLVTEALLGALLVKLEHVARNADPYTLSLHLVNTLMLIAFLTLTAWWTNHPAVQIRGRALGLAIVSLAAVMLLAVTGAIAALGDTLFPATTLVNGLRQDFDPAANVLLRLRGLHPLFAVTVAVWLTWLGASRVRTVGRPAVWLIAAAWQQILAGLINLMLLAPVFMQMIHLLLADLVWIALVIFVVSSER